MRTLYINIQDCPTVAKIGIATKWSPSVNTSSEKLWFIVGGWVWRWGDFRYLLYRVVFGVSFCWGKSSTLIYKWMFRKFRQLGELKVFHINIISALFICPDWIHFDSSRWWFCFVLFNKVYFYYRIITHITCLSSVLILTFTSLIAKNISCRW